jgi:hypothetical protein
MSLLSPGVQFRELDFSTYAIQLAQTVFAVAGESFKGMETPIEITGVSDMLNKVGQPYPPTHPTYNFKDYSLYALDQYFKFGRKALFQRVVRTDAVRATSAIILNSGTNHLFYFSARSKGDWANSYAITISNVDAVNYEFDLSIGIMDPTGNTSNYVEVERYDAVTLNPSDERYVETIINDGINGVLESEIVTITVSYDWSSGATVPVADIYVMGAGTPGFFGLHNNQPSTSLYMAALDKFKDPESYDINLLAVPGLFSDIGGGDDATIAGKLKEICEFKRQDCMALIDPPKSLSTPDYTSNQIITDVKTWRSNLAHDSSYTCIFWPWLKILDTYNNIKLWVPPSGVVAQRMAYTDFIAAPWFAPAGLNRGILSGIQDIGYVTTQDDRDDLYDRRVNINVIKRDPAEGFVLWGNRTNQAKPTARDQITVRRMLLYIQKIIATSVKYLVFEPNDPTMWATFKGLVIPVLEEVKTGRGLEDYKVIMDSSTNTPLMKSRKEAYGIIKLIPTNTAEKISMDFSLYASGASFQ